MRLVAIVGLLSCSFLSLQGCASLSKEHYTVCPYDVVWQAAEDTMKALPIAVKDKDRGLIETRWVEFEGPDRRFGLFARRGFDNKDRASMTVIVKRMDEVTQVSVTERRERWHPKGGATSGATRWWPIEPSQESMSAVINRINAKLKEQGCATPS